MERVWKRVQSAGRRVGSVPQCGCLSQPCQLHVQQQAKRSTGNRKSRGPQTIVCGCQVQPCPVHPVLIRVRKSQRPPLTCDCPQELQPCPHAPRPAGPRRVRRCDCSLKPCRHMKRRPYCTSSILPINPATANNDTPSISAENICKCREKAEGANSTTEKCECQAKPCLHTIKTRRPRRACNCPSQPCPHKPLEGRIKRVKCRVRRAGCAMARCTAELTMLHFHWEFASECAPCRPRGLTRRFCRRQRSDNELYRSNSFKFERFERDKDEVFTPNHNQISLCEDYSLPVDFVNKRRQPIAAAEASSTVKWSLPSLTEKLQVEILETYCDPKDIRNATITDAEPQSPSVKIVNRPNRNYCQPYTDLSASASSEEKEYPPVLSSKKKLVPPAKEVPAANDSVQVDSVAVLHLPNTSLTDLEPIRHSSPYYYGDLFKPSDPSSSRTHPSKYRKSLSLNKPEQARCQTVGASKRNSLTDKNLPYRFQSHDLLSPICPAEDALQENSDVISSCMVATRDPMFMPPQQFLNCDLRDATCPYVASAEEEDEVDPPKPQTSRLKVKKLKRSRKFNPNLVIVEDKRVEGVTPDEDYTMASQRQLYETAFDCKISRSDNELDDIDRVSNHPVLHSYVRGMHGTSLSCASSSTGSSKQSLPISQQPTYASVQPKDQRRKVVLQSKAIPSHLEPPLAADNMISSLSEDINSLQINSGDEKSCTSRLAWRTYTPSPPSTAPLPNKFHGKKDHSLLNMHSAPNLPYQSANTQFEDLRLSAIAPLETEDLPFNETNVVNTKARPKSFILDSRKKVKEVILESRAKPRPKSLIRELSNPIMEFKGRPQEVGNGGAEERRKPARLHFNLRKSKRRTGYSSTESITTSSSGDSMESLRSSTSEGNRSTSSSESRHSTSLSSHSSDSESRNFAHCRRHHNQQSSSTDFLGHTNKLHILSPISDKSAQEPASETSENNRNNNSQKGSPEDAAIETVKISSKINTNTSVTTPTESLFKKRRAPQNKNLINLALQSSSSADTEIQGSDSGISIESRSGLKSKQFNIHQMKLHLNNINLVDNDPEISDLPFDMPKLRRRRLLMQQDATTSGSATSVDLRDLPFDMPKLRRRLKHTQDLDSSASLASSSLSIRDEPNTLFGNVLCRPRMTLNLDDNLGNNSGTTEADKNSFQKPAGLNLGLPLELNITRSSADLVDVDLPLEKQGWYHGSITRVEAESILRLLREGSYLVRNSESTKQDYSLSLKSARGFMHMRIQQNPESNAYILGQFSKPFNTIPEMVRHFSVNRLPIRGAEHMCLLHPVIAQLL